MRDLVRKRWHCPICGYRGFFLDGRSDPGSVVRYAECPDCRCQARHRLEKLVLDQLAQSHDFSAMRLLHFAPEPFLRPYFRQRFRQYTTADLAMEGVDLRVDLTALPLEGGRYDMVVACHVLEHIRQDRLAIAEIRRVLAAGGLAVLAVPVNGPKTVEYPHPNPAESGHVRAPGPDYFDRLLDSFARVELYPSERFPDIYQTRVWMDWSRFPTKDSPLRLPLPGGRHSNIVAVCYA
jgi:SAM-dependent methyltransferase